MVKSIPPVLSPRLRAVLSLIEPCGVLADIGADHALLSAAAVLSGKAERALACDIHPGPLARAERYIRANGLDASIETRLGDGLGPVAAGEAEVIAIAGMGGMRMIEMIAAGLDTARAASQLVLQPQHDLPRVRKALHGLGFTIADEILVRDSGFYYHILSARPGNNLETTGFPFAGGNMEIAGSPSARNNTETAGFPSDWSETEYRLGRHPLARGGEVFRAYLDEEIGKLAYLIEKIESGGASEASRERLAEARRWVAAYREIQQ